MSDVSFAAITLAISVTRLAFAIHHQIKIISASVTYPRKQKQMDQNATEAAFIVEVSTFLNATNLTGGSDRAGTSDTHSGRDRREVSKHLTSKQKAVLRKKRYERRLKNERDALRDMVSALSSRLEQLRRSRGSGQRSILVDSSTSGPTWRALALSRSNERHQAEEEKLRLEATIDQQATYISILQELLPKKMYEWVAITAETRSVIVSSRLANMRGNHALFASHLREVFAAYALLDNVLRGTSELDGIAHSLCRPTIDSGDEYLRHVNRYTVPFSFKQTSKAWWQITNLNQWIQEGDGYADLADPNDTVILRSRVVRTLPNGMTVSASQRYILRRFVEATRAVFMWKTYSEGEGTFTGAYVEETGWARLQPTMEGDSTEISVCVHQAPMQVGGSASTKQEFCDVMHGLLNETAQVMMNLLSKKLLEETLSTIEVE
ncbi:hypothetical protein F441_13342 [Phytophthora nicotianae CJ01A1]|uniref:BZIP domain-containing protein n=1 Tax=Phytophthora nicotianae CJ01A1 TaxID=1317063 RepID=W2WL61_PHYNI|nr:hypothetical protein F441_13342 [Phytophthora nicotianae CJ01A1]